jgi:acylglycerol lipase
VNHRESTLTGARGLKIYWQVWTPDLEPRAVVVIAHGLGEHSGRYLHVANRLVAEGYVVYALDHRGHGRSEGARAVIDRMDNAVADLDSLIVLAAAENPARPVFLLGHSMGGAVALRYTIAHQQRLTGLILSGPLAALEAAPAPVRAIAKLLSAVAPKLGVIAIDSSLVSRDPGVVEAYTSDPLVHHQKIPARTVAEIAAAVESFPDRVGAITIPTLVMYGTADGLVPTSASVMLSERIGAADRTLTPYEGLYHEILNEPEQQLVMDEVCAWLAAHLDAVASASRTGSR